MPDTKLKELCLHLPPAVLKKDHVLNNWHKFPAISFGVNSIDGFEKIHNAVDVALETGYRSFDCSPLFTQEEDLGLALEQLLPKHELKRHDILINTKIFPKNYGEDSVVEAFQRSCENLKTNYIDTYLMQWPGGSNMDPEVEENVVLREETWKELEKLSKNGLVQNIGVCNFEVRHLQHVMSIGSIVPAINQVEFHPKFPQVEVLDFCKENNILLQTIAFKETFHPLLLRLEAVKKIARSLHKSPTQVLLKWCLNKGAAVISQSESANKIKKNFELFDFVLEKPDMNALNSISDREKYLRNPVIVI